MFSLKALVSLAFLLTQSQSASVPVNRRSEDSDILARYPALAVTINVNKVRGSPEFWHTAEDEELSLARGVPGFWGAAHGESVEIRREPPSGEFWNWAEDASPQPRAEFWHSAESPVKDAGQSLPRGEF
ncbi:hypothetical protein AcW1_001655 [Taiwanofungus camphoratus]|nr:hypothetical protein AcV7_001512 [Antrodia cinnamomea]KAI0945427.1 hypothetical protein AcW1_001655 [Antrodia cinnamomea]